ncbi:sensor histidine kinase, partial [Streptomyces iakyrus]
MIVFELITNSARHAFLSGTGKIDLELFTTSNMIACRISDNGVAHPGAVPGRGLRIVAALVSRLHGTIDVKSGPQGTSSTVIFPMTYNAEA